MTRRPQLDGCRSATTLSLPKAHPRHGFSHHRPRSRVYARRHIVHVNVTRHPTAEWTARQITEAFPGDGVIPRYLHRDRDSVFGEVFRKRVQAFGIKEIVSAKQSPWQNPFVERVIGSIRRECTDYIVALGEGHLRRVLRAYAEYCDGARCHQSLGRNAPEPREIKSGPGPLVAVPHLGGLHHRYRRAA